MMYVKLDNWSAFTYDGEVKNSEQSHNLKCNHPVSF